jgi:hypothetical protein
MIRVTSRYNTAFLNHNGDSVNLLTTLFFIAMFIYFRFGYTYAKNGAPLVEYAPILAKGNSFYAYYGLANPKAKKEPQMFDMSKDPHMSYFRFSDLTKVFPFTDQACPPDGSCHDNIQVQVKMSME